MGIIVQNILQHTHPSHLSLCTYISKFYICHSIQVQTNKLSDEAQNYATQIAPVGDIVLLHEVDNIDDTDSDDDDDNQNNYHQELSNHVIKFNSLPPSSSSTYRSIDHHHSRQRHHTPTAITTTKSTSATETVQHNTNTGSNKWMDRLMGHKRWGKLKIEK